METMRAIVQHAFGGPEVLELEERPVPEPAAAGLTHDGHDRGPVSTG